MKLNEVKWFFSNGFLKWGNNINGDFYIVCLTGSQGVSGPTTPLPDKKLLLFILDRLQKCVPCLFVSLLLSSFSFLSFLLRIKINQFCYLLFNNHLVERTHMGYSLSQWIQKRCVFLWCYIYGIWNPSLELWQRFFLAAAPWLSWYH